VYQMGRPCHSSYTQRQISPHFRTASFCQLEAAGIWGPRQDAPLCVRLVDNDAAGDVSNGQQCRGSV
jgi:hypothetical protein